jgi:hypothetical protein
VRYVGLWCRSVVLYEHAGNVKSRSGRIREDNTGPCLRETGRENAEVDSCERNNEPLSSTKVEEFPDSLCDCVLNGHC